MPIRRPSPTSAPARTDHAAGTPLAAATPPDRDRDGGRVHVLSVPFEERAQAAAAGARWDPALRLHLHTGPSLPAGLRTYASADYSWERWREDDLNGTPATARRGPTRMRPRPHQVEAAQAIAKAAHAGYRGFIEADDVGTGKTIATWCGVLLLARVRPVRNVLVLCPKGVVEHWRSTIAAVTDGGLRVCVLNYDRAKSLLAPPASATKAKRTRTRNARTASHGRPLVDWDVVIADESHKLKNPSQRRAAVSRIARYGDRPDRAPFVIWMSATIGQNPVEVGYVAPLLAQITGDRGGDLADFGPWLASRGFHVKRSKRYTDKWEWCPEPADATAAERAALSRQKAADVTKMHHLLFGSPGSPAIRRLPTDIAGWPEVHRILHPVHLDPVAARLYSQAWTEFRSDMSLAQRGRDPKGPLAARTRFRQKASLLRVPGTVEHALDLLDNGHQVAISCEWLETIAAIREALEGEGVACAQYTGANAATREQDRLAFQRGRASVMLFSVAEAISLHAGEDLKDGTHATAARRTTLVHDPRYSGLDSIQIEGRCHRDGQAAVVYYCYAAGTVEEPVVRTLLGRVQTTKAMQGDDVSLVRRLEAMLDSGGQVPATSTDADPAGLSRMGHPRATSTTDRGAGPSTMEGALADGMRRRASRAE